MTKNKKDKWLSLTISELGKVITGKTPSSKNPEFFGDIYPFITPTDMEFDHIRIKTERFLSEQGRIKQSNLLLPKNSICFTCIGATIGKICMTKSESFTNQQINSLVVDHKKNSPYFIYSLLRTLRYEIISIAGGSAIPIVNKTAFSKISISVPPLPTQQKIAGILSAYDDLIENNTRRIEILEEMARMLYREWFVKFRFPGHEAIQFVESELGLIPEGWEVKKLGDITEITSSKRIYAEDYISEGIRFYRQKEIIKLHSNEDLNSDILFISNEKFNQIKNKFGVPQENDISGSSQVCVYCKIEEERRRQKNVTEKSERNSRG